MAGKSSSALTFLGVFISAALARADVVTYPLYQTTLIESSGAVINSSSGNAHPPLQVQGWDSGTGAQTTAISIGNGDHGSFNSSTYLNFHSGPYNGDKIVRIDTDAYQELRFTDFTLNSDWTLKPTGSRPLIIRSLSTVRIDGKIDCDGGAGEDLSASTAITPNGGTGRCGGANGGNGGSLATTAAAGSQPSTNTGARGGGGLAQSGGGGGGAGMDSSAPSPGTGLQIDDATPSGAAGTAGTDSVFANIGGGAGGGGGERHDGDNASGGAGGAGGGSIYIFAKGDVTITGATGFVYARGGSGGGSVSGRRAGAGGAGAGGSILILSAGNVFINGIINALGGTGGISAGGNGGNGGSGRSWIADSDTNPSGTGTLDPGSSLVTLGTVNYQTGNFEIISSLIDLRAKRPELESISIDSTVSGASSFTLQVASGDEAFTSSSAQWVAASSLAAVTGKRYLRIRVFMNNQSTTSPTLARSISIVYHGNDQSKFDFSSCQLVRGVGPAGGGPGQFIVTLLALTLPFLTAMRLRRQRASISNSHKKY